VREQLTRLRNRALDLPLKEGDDLVEITGPASGFEKYDRKHEPDTAPSSFACAGFRTSRWARKRLIRLQLADSHTGVLSVRFRNVGRSDALV